METPIHVVSPDDSIDVQQSSLGMEQKTPNRVWHSKNIISHKTLLSYPNSNKLFNIHMDDSNLPLGAVISQNSKQIAFYRRTLNPAQTRYTTTEEELLAIVETLKEFKNILLVDKH